MKKILCLIFAALLFTSACPALANEAGIIDAATGLIYTAAGEIVGISEGITDIRIPANINGTPINKIAREAFASNQTLMNVSMEEGISVVDTLAFFDCTNLQSVIMPSTVTDIGAGAFYKCTNLITVNIPKGTDKISDSLFAECASLAIVNLPESVKYIYDKAFYSCKNLRSIRLPEGTLIVGNEAFFDCSALESVYISSSVTNIGENAFTYCNALKKIEVNPYNISYQSDGKALFTNNGQTLVQYAAGLWETSYTIPSNVDTIASSAFVANANLLTVNLGNVRNIGEYAFYGSANLSNITIPKTVQEIGVGAFSYCYKLKSVIFCGKTDIINAQAFGDDYMLNKVVFYQNPVNVGENIFENDPGVTVYTKDTTFWQSYKGAPYLRCEKLIEVFVNDNEMIFDVPPSIENDRTMVPMRAIFEALGAQIWWDDTTKTVTATRGNDTITLKIGDLYMYKNGTAIELDTPAKIENSRTLVPVRAVSEGLSGKVSWDGVNRIVYVKSV